MDPLTLSAVGGVVLGEGIKFLYNQAGEILRRRRERRETEEQGQAPARVPEPVPVSAPDILEGELAPVAIDFEAVERLEQEVRALRSSLQDYAEGIEPVSNENTALLKETDALRRSLEAIYQQRITFKGEERPPSGPVIEGRIDVEEVAGYAAAVRADVVEGAAKVTGEATFGTAEEGAEGVAVDVKRIG
jgi:hypothetical protein